MRSVLLATLVACGSPASSPATHTASPTSAPAGETSVDPGTDGWSCFDRDGTSACRDSRAGCEHDRDSAAGASGCTRVADVWCYEHGEEDELGIREESCMRTKAECASKDASCVQETKTAMERFEESARKLDELRSPPQVPGAVPASGNSPATGFSCYEYYNKVAQLTDTICVATASCEADLKSKTDTKLATNATPCKAVPSVWCFPFAGKDTCVPSRDMCQQRRESRLRDDRSAANDCVERRS